MRAQLKPLAEQVVVVAGDGAGLRLAVAQAAAKAGAAVVLAGPDEPAVRRACEDIAAAGGRAHPVIADPAAAEGCERIARAAVARFDRIDGWVDTAEGGEGLAAAAETLVRHLNARGATGALVGFGRRLPRPAAEELRRGRSVAAATLIGLPRDLGRDGPKAAAAQATLYALVRPMGRMVVASRGRRLTAMTEVSKHREVMVGVGLLALAGAAVWLSRGRIAETARPALARAVRPRVARTVRKRPLQAARLAVRHPRQALKLARILR